MKAGIAGQTVVTFGSMPVALCKCLVFWVQQLSKSCLNQYELVVLWWLQGRVPGGWYCPSPQAFKEYRTQPEALRKAAELAGVTCSKGIISAFSLNDLSVASQLLKSSWRSSGSGRDSAIPLLQSIPRRREMRRGWGRPHTLRYCWVFMFSCL